MNECRSDRPEGKARGDVGRITKPIKGKQWSGFTIGSYIGDFTLQGSNSI